LLDQVQERLHLFGINAAQYRGDFFINFVAIFFEVTHRFALVAITGLSLSGPTSQKMVQGHYEQQNRAPHRNGEERIHAQKIEAAGQHLQHDNSENHTIETFIVATGVAPAPLVFNDPPFPDADHNPATNPVQLYHLGLWFKSPQDAQKAGGPSDVTPFNGTHNAGVQVLNTTNFPDDFGPLRHVNR
jgi:hypothetical protein